MTDDDNTVQRNAVDTARDEEAQSVPVDQASGEDDLREGADPVVPYGASVDGGQLDRIDAELTAVDAAMARIDAGAYGKCEVCGAAIDDALLGADPTLATCPAHVHLR